MRYRVELAIVRALIAFVRLLPYPVVQALGTGIGSLFYLLDVPHRRIADANLAAAFPHRSAAERRAIVRAAFGHFGRLLFEVLKFSTLTSEQKLARIEVEGEESVRAAYAAGKGVFFVTAHFGNWEVNGVGHALWFEPIGVMARPLDNAPLNSLLESIRQETGNTVIYRQGSIRRVLRMLQEGHGVAVLIDQHIHGPDAVYVDYFNRPAATTSAIAALAMRTGAALVPCYTIPIAGGRYRMMYEPPVELPPPDSPDPIREITQRCTDVLEMYVRRQPHLWLWMHRRWRANGPASDHVPGAVPANRDLERAGER